MSIKTRTARSSLFLSTALLSAFPAHQGGTADLCGAGTTVLSTSGVSDDNCELGSGEGVAVTPSGAIDGSSVLGVVMNAGATNVDNAGSITGLTGVSIAATSAVTGGIANSGTINGAAAAGISIVSTSTLSGGITNAAGGTISANQNAIDSTTSSTINGGISNAGTITTTNGDWIHVIDGTVTGGITNTSTGVVTPARDGIRLNRATVSGGILNAQSGVITAGDEGLDVDDTTINGDIVNHGSWTGADDAILLDQSATLVTGDIVNSATGTLTATAGDGIYIDDTASVAGSILNAGTITAGDDGVHLVSNASVGGSITNSGTIVANNDGIEVSDISIVTGAITNSGLIDVVDSGIEISTSSSIGGAISNTGTIEADGDGIRLEDSNTIAPAVTNSGTITAGTEGIEIAGTASVTGQITNSGTITSTSASGIFVTSSSIGGITNNAGGTITGSGFAIEVISEVSPFTVTNAGILDGNVQLSDSDLVLNGGQARIIGNVQGFGTDVTVNGNFASEGTFDVDNIVVSSGATFSMGGDLTATQVTNSGTLAVPDGSAHTITGAYTQAGGGTLQIGASSAASYGSFTVTGVADLSASNTIAVDVSGTSDLSDGDVLTDVLTAGTLTATNILVSDNSVRLAFSGTLDGNTVDLAVSSVGWDEIIPASNTSAQSIGRALTALEADGPSTEAQAVMDALNSLATVDEIEDAVSQLAPSLTGNHAQIDTSIAVSGGTAVVLDRVFRLGSAPQTAQVGRRSDSFRFAQNLTDFTGWVRPFAEYISQQDTDNATGYTVKGSGIALGVDGWLTNSKNLRGGVALSFGRYSKSGEMSSVDTDNWQLTGYGTAHGSRQGQTHFLFALGTGQNQSTRNVRFGGLDLVAEGQYDSTYGVVSIDHELPISLSGRTQLIPSIGAQYVFAEADSYTETGAPGANLSVAKSTSDQTTIRIGSRIVHQTSDVAAFSAHAGINLDLFDAAQSVSASFSGGSYDFEVSGASNSRLGLTGGGSYELLTKNGLDLSVRYDVELRDASTKHALGMNIRIAF